MATSDSTGANSGHAQSQLQSLIAGGADVRLLKTVPSYTDGSTDLDSYEIDTATTNYSPVTVAEADWTVSTGATFSDAATLENANVIDFGTADSDWGQVVAVAVDNGTNFFMSNEPSGDITNGTEVSIDANAITHTLGN